MLEPGRESFVGAHPIPVRHGMTLGELAQLFVGEKWVGGARPTRFEHVFASIQSLHAADLDALPRDHFDVVIVDEFHHAAASSYQRLLDHHTV